MSVTCGCCGRPLSDHGASILNSPSFFHRLLAWRSVNFTITLGSELRVNRPRWLSTEKRSAVHGLYLLPPSSRQRPLIKRCSVNGLRPPSKLTLKTKCNFRAQLHVYFSGKKRPHLGWKEPRLSGSQLGCETHLLEQTRRVTFGS